jgi:Tol biopolymer transport system component
MGKRLAIVLGVAAASVVALGPSTASATFPGKTGPIAFTAYHDLGGQCPAGYYRLQAAADEGIFTMDPDGSNASQVSSQHRPLVCSSDSVFPDPDYRSDNDPSYSPSGKRFVFTLATYSDDCNNCDYGDLAFYPSVAVMDVDGTHRRSLSGSNSSDPAFSPNGKKVVFRDHNKIAVMSSKGRHERPLTRDGDHAGDPGFFPSGARIVYVSEEKLRGRWKLSIATIRLDSSHRRRLLTLLRSAGPLNSPDVSPNGKRIVFGLGTGIYIVRSDGTHKHRLADGSDPVFSPNGKRIAFSRVTGTGREIMVMRTGGSDQHAVIPNPLPFGVTDPSDLDLADPSWGPKP